MEFSEAAINNTIKTVICEINSPIFLLILKSNDQI